jgi:hypothetical protein
MNRWITWALATALLAGCDGNNKSSDTDEPPAPTEPPSVDTADTATAPPATPPPSPEWDSGDTGTLFQVEYRGWAVVVPGSSFTGWEALAVRWVYPGGLREPGCALTFEAKDWDNDPIRNGNGDPLSSDHAACTSCDFAFTVSLSNPVQERGFPWPQDEPADTDAGADTDASGDTDPADTDPDTDVPDTDPPASGDGGFLSCENLVAAEFFAPLDPSEESWYGYGYDPTVTEPSNPNVGAWMFWDANNGAWVPYSSYATFEDNVFQWDANLGQYLLY